MTDENKCPHCGKPVPPTALGGICPECMLKAGLAAQTEGPGGAGPQGTKIIQPPFTPAEITALFPQLEILECLGRGGMGVVYKARQPRLNRLVALKILAQEKDRDGQFTERFAREAQALARLSHPNIVTVHDFGCVGSRRGNEKDVSQSATTPPPHVGGYESASGGLFYLVMEFVDGLNLRQLLLNGKLAPEQAMTIVPKICEALQYAHEQGIVHRDIKPENILMDKSGRVKIADFGIAKMLGLGNEREALTGAKDVVGTPHYMAPEQLEQPLTVDHRADIYSLGVVFYEMLTGELPLGKFALPSKKVQIDVRLDEVVMHTLEKEPDRRYQHANQLKTDVETISGTAPGAAGFAAKGGAVPLLATQSDRAASDKAILPAFLMAFFFGVFGAHRFYVGKIRTAFLQLGLWGAWVLMIIGCATTGATFQPTLGILLGFSIIGSIIWATIDWILILCKGFTDGQGKRISHWVHPGSGGSKPDVKMAGGTPPTPSVPPAGATTGPQPARPNVPEPFTRTVSSPPRTSPWRWILIAVVGMIIIGLISAVILVREVVGRKALETGDSTTVEKAVSGPPVPPETAAPVAPPVRIKAGSSRPLTDSEGNLWLADQGFADGETTERSDHLAIANTGDPALYQAERYGMTSFAYPVPNGKYILKLHFAETYDAIKGPGGRVFTFIVEGHEFKNFDVWARAGGAQRACVETVNVDVTDGTLNISFIPQTENPEINGIEILPAPTTSSVQTDSNVIVGPAAHQDSGKTFNISSQNGHVVIETTNGRITADKVQLQTGSQGTLTLASPKMDDVVTPTPQATPVPPGQPSPTTVTVPAITAGTLSEPRVQQTKIIGNLFTKDEYQQDFNQTLPLTANGRLTLDNINGRIEIHGWDQNTVVIKALKHGKTRDSVDQLKILVDARPEHITIHTKQPEHWFGWNHDSATVDYILQVPQHAQLAGISSVNGPVVIDGVSGTIEASSVNGPVQVRGAASDLKLSTVNGHLEAQMVALGKGQSVSLDAVNGHLELTLPATADATVSADTVNGGLSSEFPSLSVKKEFPLGRHLTGTLGNGGARVTASTVNGGISFRRGAAAN